MRGMVALRYLYVLALVAWLGGTLDRMLDTRRIGASVLGALMLAALVGMRLLGPKPVHFNIRIAIVFIMLAAAVYVGFGSPGLPVSRDAVSDGSTLLTTVVLIGGLTLLYWEARE